MSTQISQDFVGEYLRSVRIALDCADDLRKSIALENARSGDGLVCVTDGPIAENLAGLKEALREISIGDEKLQAVTYENSLQSST